MAAALPGAGLAQSPPATYYGTAAPGDSIEVRHGASACGSAVAGADGIWQLQVVGSACGASEGASLAFYRNGVDSGARETFRPGGVPSSATTGVVVGGAPTNPAPAPAPAPGARAFSGATPPAGAAGLLVTSEVVTPAGLRTGLGAGGCRVQAMAVLRSGSWLVYIEGAPSVVNAAFPASLPATTPFFVRC